MTSCSTAPVSVVIPCYRCANTIGRAVSSVLSQSVLPEEIILVDDATPDGGETLAALNAIRSDAPAGIRVKVESLEWNSGPAAARNRAWRLAACEYIAFLDADDAWHPRKIEVQWGMMKERTDLAISSHETFVSDGTQQFPPLPPKWPVARLRAASVLCRNSLPTRSVMLRRDVPLRFEEGKRYSEDYLLWLRMLLSGHLGVHIGLRLACSFKHDFGAGGLSGRLWEMEKGELDTYWRVCSEGLVPRSVFPVLAALSSAKFVLRLARNALKRQDSAVSAGASA